jgi:hypothetical protein
MTTARNTVSACSLSVRGYSKAVVEMCSEVKKNLLQSYALDIILCSKYKILIGNSGYYSYIKVPLIYKLDSAYPCLTCQIATGILFLECGTEENNETRLSSGS